VATVLIKKYGNRRLYDTGDSRYITLDELAAKIRSGADVRIVDAQTSEDLTQATLVQVVLETGNAAKFLPVQLLTQMIRLSDDALAEFFSRYVTNALDLYLHAKRGMQSLSSFNPLAQIPMAATDALARMWMGNAFGGAPPYQPYPGYPAPPANTYPIPATGSEPDPEEPAARRPPGSEADGDRERAERNDRAADMAAMRRELEELKQAVRDSIQPKARRKRKP
jgi:polyhydroxyalkanoate synthesis repressor PhaR